MIRGKVWIGIGSLLVLSACSKPAREGEGSSAKPAAAPAPKTPSRPPLDTKQLESKLAAAPWQGVVGGKPALLLIQRIEGALYASMLLARQSLPCTVSLGDESRITIQTRGRPSAGGLAYTALHGKLSADARSMKGEAQSVVKQGFMEQASGIGEWELKQGDDRLEVEFFKTACEAGGAWGCFNYGVRHLHGRGVAKDDKQGFELVRKACEGGLQAACSTLALLHRQGRGTRKDPGRALVVARKACDAGDLPSCTEAGFLLTKKKAFAPGIALYRKACDGGSASGCNGLAWTLAERGQDLDQALALAQKAVKLEPSANHHDTLAYVHLKRKDYDLAEQEATLAVGLDSKSEELKKRLAEIRAAKAKKGP